MTTTRWVTPEPVMVEPVRVESAVTEPGSRCSQQRAHMVAYTSPDVFQLWNL